MNGAHRPALNPWKTIFLAAGLLLFAVSACARTSSTPAGPPPQTRTNTAAAPAAASNPPTAVPLPTSTPSPTITPSPTKTRTPTPTSTPPHPLTIAYLRQQRYPGSELVVEETLANGPNYFQSIVSYQSEGLKIRALLTIPFGDPPEGGWPAIVFNHGYIPPEIYRTTERYVAYVAAFASNGYVVLRPDYRGHDQSEGEATGAYGSPGYTIDVLNAAASLKLHPLVDPDRIGMWGHSMGGYITLRAMVVDPDIKAGVIWAGVVGPYPNLFNIDNFYLYATPPPQYARYGTWRTDLVERYGTPEENPEFWASLSANSYLGDLSGPIQLHHGTWDSEVPYSVSELLFGQLQDAGQTAEFYGYPGDDHNLSIAFSLAMQRSIQWFDRYVKGGG